MQPLSIFLPINFFHRHNEDGSYTYGYEASDGSFKLETRFPDGLVQGKYGYIDIDSGELKVIEYGADMMGFQPEGDLPEGIIIPPPVFNNITDDGSKEVPVGEIERPFFEDESRVRVAHRGRVGASSRSQQPSAPVRQQQQQQQGFVSRNQNRGQELERPITPRPQPRLNLSLIHI